MTCCPAGPPRLAWASGSGGHGRGSFWSYRPFTVIEPGPLGFLWSDAVGEGATFSRRVVRIFVLGALGVEEPVELLLVEGGTLLRPVGNSDGIVGAALAITGIG